MPTDHDRRIAAEELKGLENRYGQFPIEHVDLEMSARSVRFYREAFKNRRGEILFVLRRTGGEILLHTKHKYPPDLYRIPGGGIDWGEPVPDSLRREVREETKFEVKKERFLGIIQYRFHVLDQDQHEPDVYFVSYVFEVPDVVGEPVTEDESEGISGFRWIEVDQLENVATALRALPDDQAGSGDWGRFRAIGHDFVRTQLR